MSARLSGEPARAGRRRPWRDRLASSAGIGLLAKTQVVATVGYAWAPGLGRSDLAFDIEWASFFVMPFVWLALFVPGVWLLCQRLPPRHALAVRIGTLLTLVCGAFAVVVAVFFVVAGFLLRDF